MAHLNSEGTSVDFEDTKAEEEVAEGDIIDLDLDHKLNGGKDILSEDQQLSVTKQENHTSVGLDGVLSEDQQLSVTKQENHTSVGLDGVLNEDQLLSVTKQENHTSVCLDSVLSEDKKLVVNKQEYQKQSNGEDVPSDDHPELIVTKQEDDKVSDGEDIPSEDSELTVTKQEETEVEIVNDKNITIEGLAGHTIECIEDEQTELKSKQTDSQVPTDDLKNEKLFDSEFPVTGGHLSDSEVPVTGEGHLFHSEFPVTGEGIFSDSEVPVTGENHLSDSEFPVTVEGLLSDLEFLATEESHSSDLEFPVTGEGQLSDLEFPVTGEGHLSDSEFPVTGEADLSASENLLTGEGHLSDSEFHVTGEVDPSELEGPGIKQTPADEQYESDRIEGEEELQSKSFPENQGAILSEETEPEICAEQETVSSSDQSKQQSNQETMDTDSRPPASCKFRYAKTIPTDTSSVIFYTSYNPKEPIVLTWSDAEAAYMSSELTVACGDFDGNVHINGRTYPVEEFSVRSYSFEIDLYLTEDVIEDEVGANETQAQEEQFQKSLRPQAVDTFRDINSDLAALTKMDNTNENGIHLTSKYEELVRQQLSHKETLNTSLENELNLSHHSVSSLKRQTPIGDTLQEHNLLSRHDHSSHSSSRHTPERDVVQDSMENRKSVDSTPVRSNYSSVRTSPHSEVIEDVLKSSYPQVSSRLVSEHSGSFHGSNRASPLRDKTDEFDSQRFIEGLDHQRSLEVQRQSPANERRSLSTHSSARQTPDRQTEEIVSRTSQISHHTTVSEPIADVLEIERNTSPHRPSHGSSRSTPQSESSRDDPPFVSPKFSLRHPQREVISDVLKNSQERLYENHDVTRSGSRPSSSGDSRQSASSRQQSLTSEQELSQYLDEPGNRVGEVPRRAASLSGLNQTESLLPPIGSQGTASMPPLAGKRITTPDNHIRVPNNVSPAVRSPLITTRTSALSNDSRLSARTVTPMAGENGTREDLKKAQDLEDSIVNLRKLLSSREAEIHQMTDQIRDLRDINRSLCQELEHSRKQVGSFDHREIEREIATLQTEKEILATEVVKLQDRLKSSRNGDTAGLDNYSPNNPVVLQRKIIDMEGHIQDMQEVNETAVAKLTKAERQVRELTDENEKLRTSRSLTLQEMQEDNRRLEATVRELKGGDGGFKSLTEMQQLKDDFCFTRDRNYRLNEENVQLKQEVGDLRHVLQLQTGVLEKHEAGDTRHTLQSHSGILDRQVHSMSHSRSSLERDRQTAHSDKHTASRDHVLSSADVRSSVRDRHVPLDNGTSYGRDEIYKKNALRDASERFPLTKENISSLERSFGSDRGRDETFRQEVSYLDKYRVHGSSHERPRSEHSGFVHSSRPLPDGEVSEKVVEDGLKPSRTHYERMVQDVSPQRRDILDQDRRDYLTKSATKIAPLSSRDIYCSVRERSHSHSHSGSHLPLTYLDSELRRRNPPLGDDSMSPPFPRENYSSQSTYYFRAKLAENHQRHISAGSDSTGVLMAGYPRKSTDPSVVNYVKDFREDFDTRRKPYQEDPGEVSDTATDILLRGEIVDKKIPRAKHWRRRSIDSDSVSSLSDADDEMISSRQRSKSVDAREDWRGKRTPTGSPSRTLPATQRLSASTERLVPGSGSQGNAGFRTVTATQLTTQHNKHSMSNTSLNSSLTHGLKPFAPRSPADINTEDVVKFSRQGGKLSQGIVKYVGHLPGRSDAYLGVELHKEEGKHDGTFDGIRYFKCKPNKGVFVAFNKVVMAWGL